MPRLTELSKSLTSSQIADDDKLYIVDTSDTGDDPAGSSAKTDMSDIAGYLSTKLGLGIGTPPDYSSFVVTNTTTDHWSGASTGKPGIYLINEGTNTGANMTIVGYPVTSGSDFTLQARLEFVAPTTAFWGAGITVYDSSSGKIVWSPVIYTGEINLDYWNNVSSYAGNIATDSAHKNGDFPPYWEVARSGSNITFKYGLTTDKMRLIGTATIPTHIADVTHVGIGLDSNSCNDYGGVALTEWVLT